MSRMGPLISSESGRKTNSLQLDGGAPVERRFDGGATRVDTILENFSDGFFAFDANWRFQYVNAAAERICGKRREDMLGRRWQDLFDHAIGSQVEREFRRVFTERVATEFENFHEPWQRWYWVKAYPTQGGGICVYFQEITDRKRAEERLKLATQFGKIGIWEWDISTNNLTWSESLYAMHGVEKIGFEATIEGFAALIHPADKELVSSCLKAALAGERPYEVTFRVVRPTGEVVWLFTNAVVVRKEGRPVRMVGATTDVTERKRVEEALRESTERFQITCRATGVTLFEQDSSLRYLWMHSPIPGYTLEGIVGRREEEIDHTIEDLAGLIRTKHEVLASRRGARIEVVNRWPDGSRHYYDLMLEPKLDGEGTSVGILGASTDMTERRSAELQQQRLFGLTQAVNHALELSEVYEAAMETIVQCANAQRVAILFCDDQGVMRFHAWRGLSDGYRSAVEGHSPWKIDEPNPQPVCLPELSGLSAELRAVVEGEGIASLAFIPITYQGKLMGKFMLYYNQPHNFSSEELRLTQTISSQVAFAVHRHRMLQHLEQVVRERTAKLEDMVAELQHLSYAITHDLRAPLRAMHTFADVIVEDLSEKGQASPTLVDYCTRIRKSALRLDRLIQDSLNYSKLVLKEVPLQAVNLATLIEGLIESYPNLQPDRADIRVMGSLPTVLGEESLLTQCFSNLLGNAVKFVGAGVRPIIQVSAELNCTTARITITDNGIGIAASAQNRLFGMFQRLTPDYEGTGIGLAIVRKVVERMGGKVGAQSEPGKGSSFWVELKLATAPPGEATASGTASA